MTPRRRLVPALAVAAALAAVAAVAHALRAPPAELLRASAGRAVEAGGLQTATLVLRRGVYEPNLVEARAGIPLRLRVRTEDRGGCATRLLAPDLGVDLPLVPGGTAEVTVPAPPRGRWLLTCEAKMVKGVVAVE